MSAIRYGVVVPLPFKITLNGAGVDLTIDSDLLDADVRAWKLTRAGVYSSRGVDVSVELTEGDGTNEPGIFYWTPANASDLEGAWFGLNVKDAAGGLFDETMETWHTGGHANALLNGT